MGSNYDVADLAVINYGSVLSGQSGERDALLQACVRWGFFYLDLSQDDKGLEYLSTAKDVLKFSKDYFGQPLDTKLKDMRDDFATFNICGYATTLCVALYGSLLCG